MYFVGVDTGGTKTRCIVVDESVSLLGMGRSGPGNFRVVGTEGARDNIEAAIREALSQASVDPSATIVGGFGMGSLDTEDDRRTITEFLEEIDVIDELHVTNDVVAAYYAFSAGEPGVAIISGTGAMALGRNAAGEQARASGWGWLFGDEGSGFDAARRGLQVASKAVDGRGDETALVDAACEHFGLETFEDVFTDVMDDIDHAKDIASFAKPVAEAADAGDSVAIQVVEEAAAELASAATAVVERLDLGPAPLLSLQGGFGSAEVVSTRFESAIYETYPQARFADPVTNPVVGTIAFLAEKRGETVTRATLDTLDEAITQRARTDEAGQ